MFCRRSYARKPARRCKTNAPVPRFGGRKAQGGLVCDSVSVANTMKGRRSGDSRSRAPYPTNAPGPAGADGARGAERRSGIRQPVGRRGAAGVGKGVPAPSVRAGKSRRAGAPCGFPPLAVFLEERGDHPASSRGGVAGKGGFQRGKTEGGNSIAGAARRVLHGQVRPSAAEHRTGQA